MDTKQNLLGEIYEKNMDKNIKKSMGKYYTPDFIIDYIIKETVTNTDVIKNPFVRVIDPSCGAGYFLLSAYDVLEACFINNIYELKEKYKAQRYKIKINGEQKYLYGYEYWKVENIHYHILTHCLYGADKDLFAVKLTIEELRKKKPNVYIENLNIVYCDSLVYWETLNKEEIIESTEGDDIKRLIRFWSKKYDYVIGNPPYIGHKQLPAEYKKWLLKEYGDVFRDKSDISFCFFKRIKNILSPDGVCGIISSRYFMESPTGISLRKYLMENIEILKIIDFYGRDIFEGIGVATAIYLFKIRCQKEKNYYIDIHKLNENSVKSKQKIDIDKMISSGAFDSFKISFQRLKEDRWMIIPETSYNIYKKIEQKTKIKLKDIALSFQGIITGCDKAFVLNYEQSIVNNIEREIVKPWIKNKDIEKYNIKRSDLYLIYSNNIDNPAFYPNSIKYIEKYKEKLGKRRECKNGLRKWYHLQWGRTETLFEQKKIVFPYKAKNNKFAIDYENLYFSADIYGLIIKDYYKEKISPEYLIGILNSNVYEFYFKLFAKKMGKEIYDYYPNSVLELSIISEDILKSIEKLSIKIIKKKGDSNILKREINEIIMNYFKFNIEEKKMIEKSILRKGSVT